GGQVAVRFGDHVVLRTGLKGKKQAGAWEAYNVVSDPNETKNLATEKPALVAQAKAILEKEWAENERFPMDKKKALN
ncbi:MAG: hypothetical protein ACI9MB_001397, partial [Verrucomicrobiales bacterium]